MKKIQEKIQENNELNRPKARHTKKKNAKEYKINVYQHTKQINPISLYKQSYDQLLEQHLASGLSYECFPALIPERSVDMETLYNWEKTYPTFLESKKKGMALNRRFWEKIALDKIDDPQHLNTPVWIFNMKNRHGWRDRADSEATATINLVLDKKQEKL